MDEVTWFYRCTQHGKEYHYPFREIDSHTHEHGDGIAQLLRVDYPDDEEE